MGMSLNLEDNIFIYQTSKCPTAPRESVLILFRTATKRNSVNRTKLTVWFGSVLFCICVKYLLFTSCVLHARSLIFHPLRHPVPRSHWSASVREGWSHEGPLQRPSREIPLPESKPADRVKD